MMDAKPATHLVLDSLWARSDPEKLIQVDQFTGSGHRHHRLGWQEEPL